MDYGICNLSNVPVRISPDHKSEMISELLFGDHFKVLDNSKGWIKISIASDKTEGWIETLQSIEITKEYYTKLNEAPFIFTNDLVDFIEDSNANLFPIILGSRLPECEGNSFKLIGENYLFEGNTTNAPSNKAGIVKTAFMYLNSPFLLGGKTPFGIDASGLTQMAYKINGHQLPREVTKQATLGEVLSFIEESEPGDLAFFDDNEGNIIHTGIVLANNYIIHSYGKVRVDRIDQSGIYNQELRKHTHKLRVIKKMF